MTNATPGTRRENDLWLTLQLEHGEKRMTRMEESMEKQAELIARQGEILRAQGELIARMNEKMEAQNVIIAKQGQDMTEMLALFNGSKFVVKAITWCGSLATAGATIIGAYLWLRK